MPILDRHDENLVGLDFVRQRVLQYLNKIVARQQAVGISMRQTLLGQEHQRHHDPCHGVMPSLPAPDLIFGPAATALRILEGPLNEMPRPLHRNPVTKGCIGLCIRQTALQIRPVELPTTPEVPATRLGLNTVPQPDTPCQIRDNNRAFLPSRRVVFRPAEAGCCAAH